MTGPASFFSPQTAAIIGASKKPGKIGYAILKNMIDCGFKGKIYPINPKEDEIAGLQCYHSIRDIGSAVDLAVVAVPAKLTVGVAEECGIAGAKNLVVVTAGFKETGKEGMVLERELTRICRRYGMRLLGPNCVGMMDTHVPINASFSAVFPAAGDIAFISQSGAMLLAILDWSLANRVGFSQVISLGNKADLNEADFIAAAAEDPQTRVILCYIEDVARGEQFLQAAREASRRKPVIILKSGTSQAGARAASSHTGALAGSDLAYETAFRQSGVIRARSMAELFDLAVAFSRQPVPAGDRVAVVTNAGGPGIIATDHIERAHLNMSRFSKETSDALRAGLPPESAVYNPVDVLGDAGADRYRLALDQTLADPGTDSALVLVCPTAVTNVEETARAIVDSHRNHPDKPVFVAYMGGETLAPGARLVAAAGIPVYTFPEPAIAAISGMVRYARTCRRPAREEPDALPDANRALVADILKAVKNEGRLVLLGSEATRVAEAYGIAAAPVALAGSPREAAQKAGEIGFPVVMKVASPQIMHKTDVGGVQVGINSPQEAERAFMQIHENVQRYLPRAVIHGVEVQKMMPKGTELIIGMTQDVQFGPLIAFGLGGIYVNLLKDVSFRLAGSLGAGEAQAMLTETRAYTLLRGYRGEKPADIKALTNMITRVARLVLDFPQIAEMDINPVFAYPDGAAALDIKITVS
ncbi:acetate--CoA ligase alpha subunit [Desulfotomaculum copahuensis]|uniref:acetate--CoA ligase alpha subunit n=1 Tax=Desulfotomaculum copahuensis TaxID=1838280 RepID=UPI000A7B2F51|nr:acetate--CoA ligase [Desulfotomaculum copahuensis]